MICPCGIECQYVYRTIAIGGEQYFSGADHWHDEDEKCGAL